MMPSASTTFQACAIDLEKCVWCSTSLPVCPPGGAAHCPVRMVWQAVGAVNIPVVGLGGIATGRDALEFIMAGATAVQVGAANFANPAPWRPLPMRWRRTGMDAHGVKNVEEIRGCVNEMLNNRVNIPE